MSNHVTFSVIYHVTMFLLVPKPEIMSVSKVHSDLLLVFIILDLPHVLPAANSEYSSGALEVLLASRTLLQESRQGVWGVAWGRLRKYPSSINPQ